MTCKDCIHYEVCNDVFKSSNLLPFGDTFPVNKFCSTFINKSDYVEIKHGYWMKAQYSEKCGDAYCSECNHFDWSDCKYCSECGARMDNERRTNND